jgi:hypothetical protein
MTARRRRDAPKPPRFPRKRWLPGQAERAQPPEKGAGYDRHRQRRRLREDEDADPGAGAPPAPDDAE